jgi:hypothetical protein
VTHRPVFVYRSMKNMLSQTTAPVILKEFFFKGKLNAGFEKGCRRNSSGILKCFDFNVQQSAQILLS